MVETDRQFEQIPARLKQNIAERRDMGFGHLHAFVGPARAGKTGRMWNELYKWIAQSSRVAAFHFGTSPSPEKQKAYRILERYKLSDLYHLRDAQTDDLYDATAFMEIANANDPPPISIEVADTQELINKLPERAEVVVVDNAHMLGADIADVCDMLANLGFEVFVSGWELDANGGAHEHMGRLLCLADTIVKHPGFCSRCTSSRAPPATRTQMLRRGQPVPEGYHGDSEPVRFEARCRIHHEDPRSPRSSKEASLLRKHRPSLTVLSGPMFSGKTLDLLARVDYTSLASAGKPVHAYIGVSARESEPDPCEIRTHDPVRINGGYWCSATPVRGANQVVESAASLTPGTVMIDRAQFIRDLGTECDKILAMGHSMVVSGLDLTFRSSPFGSVPILLAKADYVAKHRAICRAEGCGSEWGTRTQRFRDRANGIPASSDDEILLPGGEDIYEPRCRLHHTLL